MFSVEGTIKQDASAFTKPQKVILTDTGFNIPNALVLSWRKAYQLLDVDREIAKAFAWIQSNPERAPKRKYSRFLNSWLSRAKPSAPSPQKSNYDSTDPYRDCSPEQIAKIRAVGERLMHDEVERSQHATAE
jgi:hypothetical protein